MAWIIDAKRSVDGPLCFGQVDPQRVGDIQYRLYADEKPPGKLLGVIHEDGQEAVEEWYSTNELRVISLLNEQ